MATSIKNSVKKSTTTTRKSTSKKVVEKPTFETWYNSLSEHEKEIFKSGYLYANKVLQMNRELGLIFK